MSCIEDVLVVYSTGITKARFSPDASVSISTSRNTKEKRHVITLKDKAKWFSFEVSALRLCLIVLISTLALHTSLHFCVYVAFKKRRAL